ncbi:MAG: hypothetical protein ACTHN5_16925 [Phycisphaerae bacterium]
MPEVPRDPRQLARDILSGKISIEELAREQQRQRAAQAGGGNPPPPVQQPRMAPGSPQARVPLPRPPVTPPGVRPVLRPPPPPPRPVQRPVQKIPQIPPAPRRQAPIPQRAPQLPARGPQIQRPAPQQPITRPANVPITTQQQPPAGYEMPKGVADIRTAPMPARVTAQSIRGNRAALRNAILMAEILGKPLALREPSEGAF